jgi:hypothetical protein
VDGNACAACHLLGAEGEVVGSGAGSGFDVDLAVITEVDEVFAL